MSVKDEKFQFHKGAIGVSYLNEDSTERLIFQFHKGAIGVAPESVSVSVPVKFQFHKGAIGVDLEDEVDESELYFNSIKVRLE